MKRFLFGLMFFLAVSTSFAQYSPSYNDFQILHKIYIKLQSIVDSSPSKGTKLLNSLNKELNNHKEGTRIHFLLSKISIYLDDSLVKNNQNNEIISQVSSFYNDFFQNNGLNIVTDFSTINKCIKKFDFIDNIAKEYNFPTELILATWYMETGCNMYFPSNGKGIFQIMSYNYTGTEFTDDLLKYQIIDYITFVRNKRAWQNRSYIAGKITINIEYNKYTLNELYIHGFLYNGIKKDQLPSETLYNNGNLSKDFVHNKDGLVTTLLKILKRRIDNNK